MSHLKVSCCSSQASLSDNWSILNFYWIIPIHAFLLYIILLDTEFFSGIYMLYWIFVRSGMFHAMYTFAFLNFGSVHYFQLLFYDITMILKHRLVFPQTNSRYNKNLVILIIIVIQSVVEAPSISAFKIILTCNKTFMPIFTKIIINNCIHSF